MSSSFIIDVPLSKDFNGICRQFVPGMGQTDDGHPLLHRFHKGNIAEAKTFRPMVEALFDTYSIIRNVAVADHRLFSSAPACTLESLNGREMKQLPQSNFPTLFLTSNRNRNEIQKKFGSVMNLPHLTIDIGGSMQIVENWASLLPVSEHQMGKSAENDSCYFPQKFTGSGNGPNMPNFSQLLLYPLIPNFFPFVGETEWSHPPHPQISRF